MRYHGPFEKEVTQRTTARTKQRTADTNWATKLSSRPMVYRDSFRVNALMRTDHLLSLDVVFLIEMFKRSISGKVPQDQLKNQLLHVPCNAYVSKLINQSDGFVCKDADNTR